MGLLLLASPVKGGGPLIVQDGQPGHWKGPVSFAIDLGPLGALSNQEAATQVRTAVSHWQAVATSTIEFSEQPSLPLDVTADNLDEFFGGTPIGGGDLRPENPIIFDDDGSIIDFSESRKRCCSSSTVKRFGAR